MAKRRLEANCKEAESKARLRHQKQTEAQNELALLRKQVADERASMQPLQKEADHAEAEVARLGSELADAMKQLSVREDAAHQAAHAKQLNAIYENEVEAMRNELRTAESKAAVAAAQADETASPRAFARSGPWQQNRARATERRTCRPNVPRACWTPQARNSGKEED